MSQMQRDHVQCAPSRRVWMSLLLRVSQQNHCSRETHRMYQVWDSIRLAISHTGQVFPEENQQVSRHMFRMHLVWRVERLQRPLPAKSHGREVDLCLLPAQFDQLARFKSSFEIERVSQTTSRMRFQADWLL